jgi:hypothetical protein
MGTMHGCGIGDWTMPKGVDLPDGFWKQQVDKLHDRLVEGLTRIAEIGTNTSSDEFEG